MNQTGHDSIHTLKLPDKNKTKDTQILIVANEESRILISKDVDFLESFIVKSQPKKLTLMKTGNIANKYLIKIFANNLELMLRMLSRSNLIEVSNTEIVEHE